MVLSIIIPCFNEHAYLSGILSKIAAVTLPGIKKEVIVVDDGSTDDSAILVKEQFPGIVLIESERNYGKAHAVRLGLKRASGDVVLIQDADLEYDPADYPALIKPFQEGTSKVVYGSRILQQGNNKSNQVYYMGGRFLSLLTNLLYGSHLSDEATGYKLFERSLLLSLNIKSTGFEFCPEVTAKLLKKGVPITEVPIHYSPRNRAEGKKVKAVEDGARAIWTLLKYKFVND